MGTSFTVKVVALPKVVDAEQLKNNIRHCLDEIDMRMSTYHEDSELSKFNRSKSTDWQPVTRSLYLVLQKAQQISRLTDGAFDVTVGPLVNLWGFGPVSGKFEVPGDLQIKQRLHQTGYQSLILVDVPMAIKKLKPDIYIDLSALAKGFAVDQVAELLQAQDISDYMVEVGGELRLKGKKADGGLWQIAIEKPAIDQRALQKVLAISDIAIATSGDYRNFFDSEGMRFSHTIDPRTGRPVRHKLASVTVLGQTTMESDALATALMVMGPEEGYNLAQQQNIAAFFIVKSDNGFVEKSTSAFTNYSR
jgi:thiamine biosynthesis lipoprotein